MNVYKLTTRLKGRKFDIVAKINTFRLNGHKSVTFLQKGNNARMVALLVKLCKNFYIYMCFRYLCASLNRFYLLSMKKQLLIASAAMALCIPTLMAETVSIGGKDYEVDRKIERTIGPGTTYLRLRIPAYPLNVNVLMVDLTNPYNRIETTVAKESSRGTESLVTAAKRQSYEGHRALAAANANFWIVATQPEEYVFSGITRNASIRNGKMITESNQHRDQWDKGTMRTGVVSLSYDKVLNIDYCTSDITITSDKIGTATVHQCNKGVWEDEIGMYNSHFGATTTFMPITLDAASKYQIDKSDDATEVILDFIPGEEWRSGTPMTFEVKEVRTDCGRGTLGNHDLALVGRGDNRAKLASLAPGDHVDLCYTWTYNPGDPTEVTPLVEQAIGGNALVMRYGELTKHNTNETYNSQVYSRTGYGCSADGRTLYVVVIDKSSDPVYGSSAGCSTSVMCEIAKHLGCWNMATFDAGGSAEMMVDNAIVNKTTEGSPRAVANGWMVYSIAPEDDNTPAALEFYDAVLEQPVYAAASPQVIAYNKYGAVIDYDYSDITFTCDEAVGTCQGNVFTAAAQGATGTLTAHCGDVSVTKAITVVDAEVALRSKAILIDHVREYPIEVEAKNAGKTYAYDPANLAWIVDDSSVATIDAEGVLRGIAEGSTDIHGSLGRFEDQATVTVEIAPAPEIDLAPATQWTVKGSSGITPAQIAADGTVSYAYASPRSPYLEFSLAKNFYSLPEDMKVSFTSDLPVSGVTLTMKAANGTTDTQLKLAPETSYTTGEEHTLTFDMPSTISPSDIAIYPLAFKRIRFTIDASSTYKGDHTFRFGGVRSVYANYSAIEDVEASATSENALRVAPNPATAGQALHINAEGAVNIFTTSGAWVSTADATTLCAPQAPGIYVLRTDAAATLLVVK